MLSNLLTAKLLSAAAAAVLATGTTASAAASGSLPDPAQNLAAATASYVGVALPTAEESDLIDTPDTTTSTTTAPSTTTTVLEPVTSTTAGPLKPGAETCAAARLEEGAKGCSEVAHQHAPGQAKKEEVAEAKTKPEVTAAPKAAKPVAPTPSPKGKPSFDVGEPVAGPGGGKPE